MLAGYPLALIIGAVAIGAAAAGAVWGRGSQARSLARALSALDEAAQGIARGEGARVATPERPEIAGLAASFNAMADAVEERARVASELTMRDQETGFPDRRALEAKLDASSELVGV